MTWEEKKDKDTMHVVEVPNEKPLSSEYLSLSMSSLVPQHPDFGVTCSFPISLFGFLGLLLPHHFCLLFTLVANTKLSILLINILLSSSSR